MSNPLFQSTLAPLVLRLALATIFIYHGVTKVCTSDGGYGTTWAAVWWKPHDPMPPEAMRKLGDAELKVHLVWAEYQGDPTPPALSFFWVQLFVAWGELLGGLALALGLFTRAAAVCLMVIQLGAIYTVTFERGFSFEGGGGYEYNLSILAMLLTLVLLGPGPFSVTELFRRKTAAVPTSAAAGAAAPVVTSIT